MKDITIVEGIKKIIPLFKRPFRAREVHSLLEYSGILSNINKETIARCLIDLAKDNVILTSDFSDRINDDYYTLPSEKVKYKMEFSSKTNLYHDKNDKGTNLGTVYQVQMKNFELIELCGSDKFFKTYGSESVDGIYDLFDKIYPSQVPRLGSEEFFIIHDYNDEIDYEISDEKNTITINSYRYGSYAQFIPLNNWRCVERIRKQYIGYKLVDKDYIFPVKVEILITNHKPNTVDFILRQLRLLNSPIDEKRHKIDKGVILFGQDLQRIDEKRHKIDKGVILLEQDLQRIDEKRHKIDKGVILLEQDLQRIDDLRKRRQSQSIESKRWREKIDLKIYLRKIKTKSQDQLGGGIVTTRSTMSVFPYRSDKTVQELKNEGSIDIMSHSFRAIDGTHRILLITHTALSGDVIKDLIRNNTITEFSLSNEIETVIDYKNKK